MLFLSACGNKAEGQTVAVVNGQEITLSELNFELGLINAPEGADKTAIRSQALQSLIDRRLLASQAKEDGIETTPDFIIRKQRGEQDLLISMLSAKRLNTVAVPTAKETDAYIASHPGMFANRQIWALQQVQYQPPTDPAVQAQIDKTKSMSELVSVLQKNGIATTPQMNRMDTAVVPPELFQKISALPAGEPFIVKVAGKAIASAIVGSEPKPIAGDEARPVAAAALRKEQSGKDMESRISGLRKDAKIEYQKGYAPAKP